MCGIIGYTGTKEVTPLLIEGLKRLEYRGYDSAGISVQNDSLRVVRALGRISELESKLVGREPHGTSGIAHTRWATHGAPSESNAHPHTDCGETLSIVHNGIIENHDELRNRLSAAGHTFKSQTDSEVIAHLLERALQNQLSLIDALDQTIRQLKGAYGIVAMSKEHPGQLLVARLGSPIVLGHKDQNWFVCSDPTAIGNHVDEVIYLEDGERAIVYPNQPPHVWSDKQAQIQKKFHVIDWDTSEADKQDHSHFMLKEILEQPRVIQDVLRGRLVTSEGRVHFGGLNDVRERLREIDRLIIVACGTAGYAGRAGEYMLEAYGRIPVEVELASEFRYRKPVINRHTAVLAVSQSGETADTLAAIREAKNHGALALGMVNVPGSTIARETDAGIHTRAGTEIGVASTKAFLAQSATFAMLSIFFGRDRGMNDNEVQSLCAGLTQIPRQIESILAERNHIRTLAEKYQWMNNALFLGRTFQAPIALEGALKLKELSYIHAEGYTSGEMKHGPLALIDERFPSIVICPHDSVFEKNISNIQELKARRGPVIAITDEEDLELSNLVDDVVIIPKTHEMLSPLLSVIPLQLFAYEMALIQGYDPDKPRNLAKSVTVE